MKIGVLFQETESSGKDLTTPERGNPGVGGTAFCFALFIKYYRFLTEDEVYVYDLSQNILPPGNNIKVSSFKEALAKASMDGVEVLLLRNHQEREIYELMQGYPLRYVFWMHNRLTYEEIKLFSKLKCVSRIIAVSHEMYDFYIDDPIIDKMTYCMNMFLPPAEEYIRGDAYEPYVTYTGSLTYDKNFHLLAAVWKEIVAAVPEAKLHVIGSGRLYDENGKMGPFGYAEEAYETSFMQYLTDEDGKQLDSVVFHGILGEEKNALYAKSAVGVVNPMSTETFSLSAIEKEACGLPVVCRRKNGLLDTVKDGETGLLFHDISEMPSCIIRLLQDRSLNNQLGKAAAAFARKDFLPENIIPKWQKVLAEAAKGGKAPYERPQKNFDNNGKRVRVLMHGLHRIPIFRWVPSIHDLQKK